MLPPILEIYVAWHPGDAGGEGIAKALGEHFHGGCYANMLGGAVEVYTRSVGWTVVDDAPRPIVWPQEAPAGAPAADGVRPAQCVAVVPVLGRELMRAVQQATSPWAAWLQAALDAQARDALHVRVLPMRLPGLTLQGRLGSILPTTQLLAEPDPHGASGPVATPEALAALRRLDLVQALAQWLSPQGQDRLRVFISHTKRLSQTSATSDTSATSEPVAALVAAVRGVLAAGRIGSFYDAHDLQPGEDWDKALREGAGTCAVLALRTDLYASRDWCQREVLLAKQGGMPVVVLDALTDGEQRGSFLLDHMPRVPARRTTDGQWDPASVQRVLQLLADAWLHRALWLRQEQSAKGQAPFDAYRWLPLAPEPSTLVGWLMQARGEGTLAALRILHPDPPLASEETQVLRQLAALAGLPQEIDIATPRLLAARGA